MNPDFKDLLSTLNARGAEFLVVGAHALAVHGHLRATKDLDVWVRPSPDNASKVIAAIAEFGAPLHDLVASDLAERGTVFQIGVPPVRIDLLTAVDGLEFDDAWKDRLPTQFAGEPAFVPSLAHLIRNKKASGRLQDLADVEALERLSADRSASR
ncbi:nucleotidyltransferase [Paludisphaera borealis]|uniref:Uncharacterized protein n=1 Tax=Paludisphaera borealis TaxID=1387353 RepID=A0A1U7CKB2_9BACT|nr:nucleotidyltransferase [Paludisphaera borealis]APW59346.1 hypothetical protein BSF38_00768 [Paludisphaera borealis]